ncbi:hypothetical protein ACWGTO_29595 [Mesorhizobium sp. PL10]
MSSWRPLKREPDAVRATLYDYLRNRAAKVFLNGGSSTRALGYADMVMSNGRTLAVELKATPVDVQTSGTRSVIVFDIEGHAAEAATGYQVQGRIILDRETLAFLSIETNPSVITRR